MKKLIKSPKLRRFAAFFFALLLVVSNLCFAAADGEGGSADIVSQINAKFDVIFTIIYTVVRLGGIAMVIWGIVQIAQAAMSHDQSQKATSFILLGFGIVLIFTKEIVTLLL